jgi:membrane-associated phospholipid phosphatase
MNITFSKGERIGWSIGVMLFTYYAAVLLVRDRASDAQSNAGILLGIERNLGLVRVENWLGNLGIPGAGAVYWLSEFAVILAMLVFLYMYRREFVWPMWSSVVIANVIGCFFFVLIPMAPPWDIYSMFGENARAAGNAIGAFPSLHQADAVIVGYYFGQAVRRKWGIILGISWEILVALDVVITRNHYVLDVVAGWLLGILAIRVPRYIGMVKS